MPPSGERDSSEQTNSTGVAGEPILPPVVLAGQAQTSPVTAEPASSKRKALLLIAGAAVILAGASVYGWWTTQQLTPDKVFTAALGKLLSTKTITQTATSRTVNGTLTFDDSNLKDPKVTMTATARDSGLEFKLNGYGSLKNGYLKYSSFGSAAIDNVLSGLVGKWVQVRTNGQLASNADASTAELADPRYLLFGDLMVGNFSTKDRQDLLQFITANKIYTYDLKHVTVGTLAGKRVYAYSITENIPKLKALNKKVAGIVGIPVADIQSALDDLGTAGTTKVYIAVDSKEIVKYTTVQDGETISGAYTDYDTTSLPQEPKADMTWAQFQQKESDLEGTGGSSTNTDITPQQV
jgi:hypothetical protein